MIYDNGKGTGRQGVVLKRRISSQKESMPCRPMPLLVQLRIALSQITSHKPTGRNANTTPTHGHACVRRRKYTQAHLYIDICAHTCIYIYIYVCLVIHIKINIYIHTHIYIYTHKYIYIYIERERGRERERYIYVYNM